MELFFLTEYQQKDDHIQRRKTGCIVLMMQLFMCIKSGQLTRKLEVPCQACRLISACPVKGLFLILKKEERKEDK